MKADNIVKQSIKAIAAVALFLFLAVYIKAPAFGTCAFVMYFPVLVASFALLASTIILVILKAIIYMTGRGQTSAKHDIFAVVISSMLVIFLLYQPRWPFKITLQNKPLSTKENDVLATLPYVSWEPAAETINKNSVTYYDKSRACSGINLYGTLGSSEIFLIDMDGKIIHKWDKKILRTKIQNPLALATNGDMLFLDKKNNLVRVDWDGNLIWKSSPAMFHFHHEITLADNGDIYALGQDQKMVRIRTLPIPFRDNYVAVLSSDGKIKKKISLCEAFKKYIGVRGVLRVYKKLLRPKTYYEIALKKKKDHMLFDHLHNNTITIIHTNIENVCRKGDLLLSPKNLNIIAVLDAQTEKIRWHWGTGKLNNQHHPTQLENGNFLVFDNGVRERRSRIIETDPVEKQIVWEYQGSPPDAFFSRIRGGCQKLPNGNILITESEKGRVFEITGSGQLVWEFYNPDTKPEENERAAIYRMIRLTGPEKYPKLNELLTK